MKRTFSIHADEGEKKPAHKRAHKLGLNMSEVYQRFYRWLQESPEEDIYAFMRTGKFYILLAILLAGWLWLTGRGEEIVRWATTTLEQIDSR